VRGARQISNKESRWRETAVLVTVSVAFAIRFLISFSLALNAIPISRFTSGLILGWAEFPHGVGAGFGTPTTTIEREPISDQEPTSTVILVGSQPTCQSSSRTSTEPSARGFTPSATS